MKSRVTQSDIAKAAGVHNTTVSLSLRNCPAIPEATRKRIQAIAAEMGYHPDPALQALVAYRAGRTSPRRQQALAYVTNWDSRWGWRAMPAHEQFYTGATRKAAEYGYQFEHFWLGEPGMSERRFSNMLFHRGITGVLLASHRMTSDALLGIDWARLSAVQIDRFPHTPGLHYVTNDQSGMVRRAVRQILAAGYKKIGLVMPRWRDDFVDQAWSAGFLTEQQRLPAATRIPILLYQNDRVDALPPYGFTNPAIALPVLENWYRRHRPEVIISYSPCVRGRLDQLGLSVPHDVAYVDMFLERNDGRIAGLRQNCERVGEAAVEILVSQLRQNLVGLPAVRSSTLIEGVWCDGESLPGSVFRAGPVGQASGNLPPLALTA